MSKKIGLTLLFFLFFTPSVLALNDDILDFSQGGSVEELSSQLEESYPDIPAKIATDLAEAIYLIRQLEREIILTHELLEIRRKRELEVEEEKAVKKEPEKKKPVEIKTTETSASEKPLTEKEPQIVIARHISPESEEALPREDWSRITLPAPAKRSATPLIEDTPPTTQTYSYTQSELENKNYSITMEKGQIAIIPAPGLKRFLATNPEIIKVSKEKPGELSVEAIGLGKGFLHIWDESGRRTLNIKVIQKGYKTFLETQERAIEAEKMQSFKVRYSFDRYRLNSNSFNPDRSYHYTEWFHRLGITGETPWGMAGSNFEYQGKGYREDDFNRDLSAWNASLIGPDIEFTFGDTGAYFSEITLPHVGYQGLRFRNPEEKKINYDIIWGARGANMWGDKVVDYKGKNYFYGARFEIEPLEFLNLNTSLLRSQGNDLETSERIFAAGAGLNFFEDALNIDGEYARGEYGDAIKIETDLKSNEYNFDFNGVYRDIASDYELVYDQSAQYRGEIGYYLKLNYYPIKFLRFTGQYDKFRDRETPSPASPKRHNLNKQAIVALDLTDNTQFTWSVRNEKRPGLEPRTRYKYQSYHLKHSFDFFNNNTNIFALYQPATYKNIDSAAGSYKENRLSVGARMNVFKNLYLDIAHLWHRRRQIESHDEGTSTSINTGASYRSRIFNTPFYGALSLRYKRDDDIISAISILPEEEYLEGEGELKYRPSSDMEMYLRVNMKDIKGAVDNSRNREEMRIYAGGSYLLDTTIRFSKSGAVAGYVFRDLDGNGVKDIDEEGVANIDIFAGEKKYTITDEKGYFKFDKLKGEEISILLDIKTLPERYSPTTANPQIVKLEREKISPASFGILAKTEISGRVFNDINMNGEMDVDDGGVKDILLTLDDGSIDYTDKRGDYLLEYVKTGERTLSINPASLPHNLLPLTDAKWTIMVEEGKMYRKDFALYALRTIVGTVFIDEDGDGKFDAGEVGLPDVELKVEDNITLTDDKGRYFLKKLKGGARRVEVVIDSIPKEYEIVGEVFRDVELAPEGEIKENVDFPLITREY